MRGEPRTKWPGESRTKRDACLSFLVLLPGFALLFVACELDAFMFNESNLHEYSLPGNRIPESKLEEVTFHSGGHTLYGFWVESDGRRPGITLLYFHGNRDHIDHYWDRVMYLHELGVNLFVFDYRGYGKSEGTPSEKGLYDDADAALDFLQGRSGFDADSLVIYGYSLGNVPALYLASERIQPVAVVAEAPYASASSLIQGSVVLDLPSGWLTKGTFDNVRQVEKLTSPFLLLHGEEDDFVRFHDNGAVVYRHAPEPRRLITVPDAGHDDIPETMGIQEYRRVILDWLNLAVTAGTEE